MRIDKPPEEQTRNGPISIDNKSARISFLNKRTLLSTRLIGHSTYDNESVRKVLRNVDGIAIVVVSYTILSGAFVDSLSAKANPSYHLTRTT
ncbi:hypothetical protein ACN38_g7046 [Penicillium nordicum]|uniref:Uncharacterized protein n=1 Tax=Penicillium nordicum TaxID=229535 RepID=A0A0M8NZI4_9EURO|nr:hypothetical protein ACN38_g7046 [Penicillium nordicum]